MDKCTGRRDTTGKRVKHHAINHKINMDVVNEIHEHLDYQGYPGKPLFSTTLLR